MPPRSKRPRTEPAAAAAGGSSSSSSDDKAHIILSDDDVTPARATALQELFEEGTLCDGEVELPGGRIIPVSRITLSAASTFFRAAFTGGMREAENCTVKLDPSLDPASVELLLRFAHHARDDTMVDPEAFIRAVDQLGFLELIPKAAELLARTMDSKTCCARLVLADQHGEALSAVFARGVELLSEHAKEVCGSAGFAALPHDLLASLLSHEDCFADEVPLYEGLLRWRAHDASRHGAPFDDLLGRLRLPSLGLEYLIGQVMHADAILASATAKRLVQEAVAYLTIPAQRAALMSPRTQPRRAPCDSVIITRDEQAVVGGWLPSGRKIGPLLHRGSRDGWTKAGIIARCADKQTVVVVHSSTDHVFGGFSDVPWNRRTHRTGDGEEPRHERSDVAFLFAIRVASHGEPVKMPLLDGHHRNALFMSSSTPIAFGGGPDLRITSIKTAVCNPGYSYAVPKPGGGFYRHEEWNQAKDFFHPGETVTLSELEVFEVLDEVQT